MGSAGTSLCLAGYVGLFLCLLTIGLETKRERFLSMLVYAADDSPRKAQC